MSNLIDIQTQIEKLQKQANEIKSKDFHATVQDILAKMAAFGITVKDLQSGKGKFKSTADLRVGGKHQAAMKNASHVAINASVISTTTTTSRL